MRAAPVLLVLLIACGASEPNNNPTVSKEPISVRGWIKDATSQTNIWVDDAPYVSGGVADNGSFLLLDVPPGSVTIELTPPGASRVSRLVLQNIPGNADVFVPGVVLQGDAVTVLDPKALQVRMAARIDKAAPANITATVAGVAVPVMNVPLNALSDRHDYPTPPPGSFKPIATVH